MYYCVTGKLIYTEPYLAVVSCGGVGYKCATTLTTQSALGPLGSEVTLYTHLNVREDALDLYGFFTTEECSAFKLLTGVSGVGPKSAIAILSDMRPDQLALCIASGDAKSLTRAPGVGAKVAQRLILELKDKITGAQLSAGVTETGSRAMGEPASNTGEAVSALCVLGYSQSEAVQALAGVAADLAVDEMIRRALKALAKRS